MGYPQAEIAMPGVQGATYCVPIWGRYYEMVFGSQAVPEFAQPSALPVYRPWKGAHAVGGPAAPAPSLSPNPSPASSSPPVIRPSATPTPAPTPTGTPTAAPSP